MQTLIFNGSPRKNGDTAAMTAHLLEHLNGEVILVRAYDGTIAPCTDCRYCRTHAGCIIQDDMQKVYDTLAICDNVILISPLYFSELSGPLLSMMSRLQMYFSARFFRKQKPLLSPKRGAVLLAGGGTGDPKRAYATGTELLHYMGAQEIYPLICSHTTDRIPAAHDTETLRRIRALAAFFNGGTIE